MSATQVRASRQTHRFYNGQRARAIAGNGGFERNASDAAVCLNGGNAQITEFAK